MLRKHRKWGLPRLRREIPDLRRNAAAGYIHRVKRILRRRRRRNMCKLRWLVQGAVWAIDGTKCELPVGENGRQALVVVDLGSHTVLAADSVPGERAEEAIACLQRLIEKHGPPIVLKADNGPAFISHIMASFCQRHGITLMHSPVYMPSYNGTNEVSNRWSTRRAMAAARLRGSTDRLCQADLDCGVTCIGTLPPVDEDLRQRFLATYAEHLELVAAQRGLVVDEHLKDHVRRSIGRVAARRALELCHILTIEGREYHQWLPASAA